MIHLLGNVSIQSIQLIAADGNHGGWNLAHFSAFPLNTTPLLPHNIWRCRSKKNNNVISYIVQHSLSYNCSNTISDKTSLPFNCSDEGKRLYKWYALDALALKAQTENDINTFKIDFRNMTQRQRCLGIKQHDGICSFYTLAMAKSGSSFTVFSHLRCAFQKKRRKDIVQCALFFAYWQCFESLCRLSVHQPQVGYPFHWDETWRHHKAQEAEHKCNWTQLRLQNKKKKINRPSGLKQY